MIACIGWGSLIWNPGDLLIRRPWLEDGPLVRVEFVRESANRRITLVLEGTAPPTRALWAVFDCDDTSAAKASLQAREGCRPGGVKAWSTGEAEPRDVMGLAEWARAREIESVVWTALGPKFGGHDGAVPTVDQVIDHLRALDGADRSNAEQYVRRAPRQIDTPYRRRIEAALNWTPLSGVAMGDDRSCTSPEECDGSMKHKPHLRYPGEGAVGRGLGEPINLPTAEYGPGWQCEKCGHLEPE